MYFDTIYASGLPSRAIMVYQYLSDRAGKDKQCFPSIRRIAADLSISESTVKRALKDLEGAGYISWMNRRRQYGERAFGKTSDLYTVLK